MLIQILTTYLQTKIKQTQLSSIPMSYSSPQQLPKYYQASNNFSSPNLHKLHINNLNTPLEQTPPQTKASIAFSPRPASNLVYAQMSNDMYTSSTPRSIKTNSTGTKLNEMSSDLAKLKQQLSKIMGQAEKSDIKTTNITQSTLTNNFEKFGSQSFKRGLSAQQEAAIPVNFNINKNTQSFPNQNVTPTSQSNKKTYESNEIPTLQTPQTDKYRGADNKHLLTNSQRKQAQINHSLSDNQLNLNTTRFGIINQMNKKADLNNNWQYFTDKNSVKPMTNGVSLESKLQEQKGVLKIRDEFQSRTPKGALTNNQLKTSSELQVQGKSKENENMQKEMNIKDKYILTGKQAPQIAPNFDPVMTKKSSSSLSHQLIVNRIKNEDYSKKLQQSLQMKQLRKKRQEEEYQYQQKIIELEHEKRKLKHEVNNALLEKENLDMALKTERAQKETLNRKYQELEDVLKITKFELDEAKTRYKLLERKLQTQLSRPKVVTEALSFDEALKQHISQISKLKQQLQDKDEEILRVKDINVAHRREIDSLHNQIKIQQLKAVSQLNQYQQKHSIILQDKQNQIKTWKNLVQTLEAKLEVAVNENKTKDAFMVQHLTGKTKIKEEKEYIENFFRNYLIEFPTNKLGQKLKEQLTQIERLKKTILEMTQNKGQFQF